MIRSVALSICLTAAAAATGCGSAKDSGAKPAAAGAPPAPASGDATGTEPGPGGRPGASGGGGPGGGGVQGIGTGTGTGTAASGTGTGTEPGGTDAGAAGRAYFAASVAPLFESMCSGCHADPRMQVAERGPLTIFSYTAMKALLIQGGAPGDNGLYNKIRTVTPHTGGDQCAQGGDAASPCKELLAWWHAENGAGTGAASGHGRLTSVSALGEVYGYAYDPANTGTAVSVTLYADGVKGQGTALGTLAANAAGASGAVAGNHAFTFPLPATLTDGKAHQLYAYVVENGAELPLSGAETPLPFRAWAFSAAGRAYYAANVQGQLGACAACHTVSYEQQFYSLIAPSPAAGATAANNQLLNKAAQANGTTHGGGLRCASATASPCAEFQAWWKLEFGG